MNIEKPQGLIQKIEKVFKLGNENCEDRHTVKESMRVRLKKERQTEAEMKREKKNEILESKILE